jgi:hypothetical protein
MLSVLMRNVIMLSVIMLNVLLNTFHANFFIVVASNYKWRHDTQHNDIQLNDTQHNGLICDSQH